MSKTLYFEGAGWSGADSSKATIGNCRIRTAFHLDLEKKHPRCSCREPHDGAAAVYLEIICGTIGKENKKLGLEPTYYGWIDYLHYVTDDDRNDDCNRHILPFERRARIGYTLESILKFVNDLGASSTPLRFARTWAATAYSGTDIPQKAQSASTTAMNSNTTRI